MPVLHLLAGPNGSGKSSYVRDILGPVTQLPFINADQIASERWPEEAVSHAYEAAQLAEQQRRAKMSAGESFITETVFSHPSKVQLVADAVDLGYLVSLHVILVPVELTVQRVSERIARGGHFVPEQKIRDRYQRLWTYVAEAIQVADTAEVLDNSSARTPFRSCARFEHGSVVGKSTWPKWTPGALR